MRRVVAVLGAVLLVVVAILVRGVIDGDDDSAGGGGGGDGSDGEAGISLVCIDELADVCDALEEDGEISGFTPEGGGETADRMAESGADLGADAWLTLEPFPEMADIGRGVTNLDPAFDDPLRSGYSTEPALVVHPDRVEALTDACDGAVTWECVSELAEDPWVEHGGEGTWGTIKAGYDGIGAGSGLLPGTEAAAAELGNEDFALNDLEAEGRVIGWLMEDTDALSDMVGQGPGAFSVVGSIRVEAERLKQTAQGADLAIFYPAPMFRAEVVLVAPGSSAEDLVDEESLHDALAEAGWEDIGETVLPSAGAIYALRQAQ